MTATPAYGFRIKGKDSGPMQQAIRAGDVNQIKGILTKRFPKLTLASEELKNQIAKPEESTTQTVPAPMAAAAPQEEETSTAQLYGDYVINLPTGVRELVTTDYKGVRGGRLGRGNYTTESIVPGAAVALPKIPSIMPEDSEEEPVLQKEIPEKRFLSSFIGERGTPGVVGAMAVGRAQGYGLSNEEILAQAQQEGLKFGEQAARGLGIETDLSSYTGLDATKGAVGMSAVTRAQERGLSNEAIKALAQQQGLKFGAEAAKTLGVGAAQTYKKPAPAAQPWTGRAASNYNPQGSLSSYVGSAGTAGAMGASAVGRAMAAGMSADQIKAQAAAQGLSFGPAAIGMLG